MLLFVGNKKVAITNQKQMIIKKTIDVTYVTLYLYTYSIIRKESKKGQRTSTELKCSITQGARI